MRKERFTVYKFVPEDSGIQISSGRAMIEYVVDGEVYAIKEASIGDTITPIDSENLSWLIGNNDVVTQNYTRIEAEYSGETRTITYKVGNKETTHTYHIGEIIAVPEVTTPEGMIFTGWDVEIPFRMGEHNLTVAAQLSEHTHEWVNTGSTGSCTDGINTTYSCFCGKTKSEKAAPCDHSYEASYALVDGNNTARIICTTCGDVYQKQTVIEYKIKDTVIDMTMLQNAETSVQPDGTITIKLAIPDSLKNSRNLKVYRVENNKKIEVPSTKEGNFLIVTLDHFSYYVISTEDNAADVPSYGQIECTFSGHSFSNEWTIDKAATCIAEGSKAHYCTVCGEKTDVTVIEKVKHSYSAVVTKPTCTTEGFTTHTCSVCGDSYTDTVIAATGHKDENNNGICDTCKTDLGTHEPDPSANCSCNCHKKGIAKFFWKIINFFHRLFKMNKYRKCPCGTVEHW